MAFALAMLTGMIAASGPDGGRASGAGPASGHRRAAPQDFVGPDESDGPSEVQQRDIADDGRA